MTDNPSDTSCMSIFIFPYEFSISLVATTVFYKVFRWSVFILHREVATQVLPKLVFTMFFAGPAADF